MRKMLQANHVMARGWQRQWTPPAEWMIWPGGEGGRQPEGRDLRGKDVEAGRCGTRAGPRPETTPGPKRDASVAATPDSYSAAQAAGGDANSEGMAGLESSLSAAEVELLAKMRAEPLEKALSQVEEALETPAESVGAAATVDGSQAGSARASVAEQADAEREPRADVGNEQPGMRTDVTAEAHSRGCSAQVSVAPESLEGLETVSMVKDDADSGREAPPATSTGNRPKLNHVELENVSMAHLQGNSEHARAREGRSEPEPRPEATDAVAEGVLQDSGAKKGATGSKQEVFDRMNTASGFFTPRSLRQNQPSQDWIEFADESFQHAATANPVLTEILYPQTEEQPLSARGKPNKTKPLW